MRKRELKSHIKKMADGYHAAGQVHKKELAALSHEEVMEITKDLFNIKVEYVDPRRTAYSGLVEFQFYMRKMNR